MVADLKPYPAMKDSGLEWLGEVPDHWETRRLRHLIDGKLAYGANAAAKHTNPAWPRYLRISDFSPDGSLRRDTFRSLPPDVANEYLVEPGDVLFARSGATVGKTFLVGENAGSACHAGYLIRARPNRGSLLPGFLFVFTQSVEFARWKDATFIISTIQNIGANKYADLPVPVPPIPEQDAIVRFLDHADRRIRRYIRSKEKLIALLEEQKQAIIHQAVTGQIDVRTGRPYPSYKDSGVEWLGQVPAHWEVCTLGRIAESFRTGPFGSMLHQSDYVEDGTPVINPIHMNNGAIIEDPSCSVPKTVAERLSSYRLCLHDLVFSRRGELGRCAMVRSREVGWLCGTGSIRVRIERKRIVPKFLIQTLQVRWVGEYLSLSSVGATMDNLNTSILKGVPLLVPPVQQQKDIVEHIGQRTTTIDYGIRKSEEKICLIRQFRTRLIADVVTGKLDVREAAAAMPGEIDAPTDAMETIELENAAERQEEMAL